MIGDQHVDTVARLLFPDETPVTDCHAEVGRVGQPCSICADINTSWQRRLEQVRAALEKAFYEP